MPSDRGLISIWNQDRRYSQLIQSLEKGRSFPNIPEWGEIESVLNQLANNIGTTLSVNTDGTTRNREVAKLLVKAHKDVNEILHNQDAFDDAEAIKRVEAALAVEIPEVMPENLKFEPSSSSIRLWNLIDVAFVLVILAVFLVPIGVIVFIVRRKK